MIAAIDVIDAAAADAHATTRLKMLMLLLPRCHAIFASAEIIALSRAAIFADADCADAAAAIWYGTFMRAASIYGCARDDALIRCR